MSAKFYFYPNPISNHLVSIDLGESLGELYSDWEYLSSSSTTMNGKIQTSVMLNREIITISRDRMKNGDDLYGEFMGLMNHLDRGNSCAFCADVNDNYAFPLKKLPVGGDTTIDVFGNPFLNMTGANVPTIGDYIVLETSPPDALLISKSPGLVRLLIALPFNGSAISSTNHLPGFSLYPTF